jgi:hypothetical protein
MRQSFNIVANIIGGYIFGLGIVMAGGCGSGIVYRMGEGYVSAFVATLGFASSLIATIHGPIKPVMQFLKSFKVSNCSNRIYDFRQLDNGLFHVYKTNERLRDKFKNTCFTGVYFISWS